MGAVTKTAADTLSLSDAMGTGKAFGFSDTLSLSDAQQMSYKFLILDQILISDDVAVSLFRPTLVIIDTLNLSDSVSYSLPYGMSFNDTLAFTDAILALLQNPQTDTLTLSDAVSIAVSDLIINTGISISDTLLFLDAIQTETVGRFNVRDGVDLTDEVSVVFGTNFNDYLRNYLNDL